MPAPAKGQLVEGPPAALYFGPEAATTRIAILPDIYGCNEFYRSLATYLSSQGAGIYLMNPFAEFGELLEQTREAAFARRHKVRDYTYLTSLEAFIAERGISCVVGFCLGGLYVMDLARRGLAVSLVALYPFPQGLENQDPLPIPFNYLPQISTALTVLVGDHDHLIGRENIARLKETASRNSRITLSVYEGSGHGFLADLDEPDALRQLNARNALATLERACGLSEAA